MQKRILAALGRLTARGEWVAVSDVSREAKVEVNHASRLLSLMYGAGTVQRQGYKKTTQYRMPSVPAAQPPNPPADDHEEASTSSADQIFSGAWRVAQAR